MSIADDVQEQIDSRSFNADKARELAKQDPDFLMALCMPVVFKYFLPPVFRNVWNWLVESINKVRSFDRLALGLPRGFGKTTLVKLFCVFIILFTKRKFILILSKTETMAANIIADIMDMLGDPNVIALFGDHRLGMEKDTQVIKKFAFRGRDIIIAGIGAGGSVRGLNLKHARPDVMIFEDIQSREDADSQVVSESLYNWMLGTALKAKDPSGCLALFVANMYPTPHSILKKLQKNPHWVKVIAGGIIQSESGEMESLWEDLQPLEQLLDEFAADLDSGKPEIFYAEVLNDPDASVNSSFDPSKVPDYPFDDDDIHAGNFIIIDPASGKHQGDDISIGYFEVHDAKPVARKIEAGKFSPGDTCWKTVEMILATGCRLVVIEGNAYQSSLCYWMNQIISQVGIEGVQVIPIYSGRNSKNSRIMEMFKALMAGDILLHPEVRTMCLHQARGFNPLKTDNTDGILDLLTYSSRVLTEFSEYLLSQTVIEMQMNEAIEISDVQQLCIV